MKYYSTRDPHFERAVSLEEAVLSGLAEDGGLYMPELIPLLPDAFYHSLHKMELPEIAFQVISAMIGKDIPSAELRSIVDHTFDFPIPVVPVESGSDFGDGGKTTELTYIIELFHGTTMAFKDVGARFMARTMGYFNAKKESDLHVIVATSGDTGGAVAAGFYDVPGVQVHILFPKGKVSHLQELQLTTWGGNIHAYRIDGTFDDCQAISKQALSDPVVWKKMRLTSANSINISRLIPQIVYYFWGASRWLAANGLTLAEYSAGDSIERASTASRSNTNAHRGLRFTYSIPSGNFGNLTAGLFAQRLGLPISRLVASTNQNSVLPDYLASGEYQPRRSVQTLSNAMDVGNPSNYERMVTLFEGRLDRFRDTLYGCSYTDDEVVDEIRTIHQQHGYHLDPHTAVATLGIREYTVSELRSTAVEARLVLGTAHPVKFSEEADARTGIPSVTPPQAEAFYGKPSIAEDCTASYEEVRERILHKS